MKIHIEQCQVYHDHRGDLIQFITDDFLVNNSVRFGQIYILTFTGKGKIRGNHYHNLSHEMFCLISGSVEMVFEDIVTKEKVTKVVTVQENTFVRIYIGPNIAHAIRSLSDFAVMVSFSSKEFDPKEDDKIQYVLI